MRKPPKKRAYDSTARRAAAQLTRHSILENARRLFLENGYEATTMPGIARAADVALETVYAAVGTKAQLFRLLVEAALSGQDVEVPAHERDYVRAIRAELDAARKLQIYASALGEMQPRLAPPFQVLQAAAPLDPDLKALWQEISRRRAANMRLLAQDPDRDGTSARGPLPVHGGGYPLEHELTRVLRVTRRPARLARRGVRTVARRRLDPSVAGTVTSESSIERRGLAPCNHTSAMSKVSSSPLLDSD